MKLLEKFIYVGISFVVIYVVLSMTLRLFDLTSNYHSHMIGGIVATFVAVGLFMFLLIKKSSS
jgi:uncharacterized membrane protein